MKKSEYMYELINQCMLIFCQDNILVENFELSDESKFYKENEKQFLECMKLYDQMQEKLERGEINEEIMEQELKTVILMLRKKALERLLSDFGVFISKTNIADKEKELLILRKELQIKVVDAEYLLNKVVALREKEESVY